MTITEAIIRFGLDKAYDKVKVFTLGNLICFFGLAVFGILLPIVSLTGIADKYIGGYSLMLYICIHLKHEVAVFNFRACNGAGKAVCF